VKIGQYLTKLRVGVGLSAGGPFFCVPVHIVYIIHYRPTRSRHHFAMVGCRPSQLDSCVLPIQFTALKGC